MVNMMYTKILYKQILIINTIKTQVIAKKIIRSEMNHKRGINKSNNYLNQILC